jgi:hypothetical protein
VKVHLQRNSLLEKFLPLKRILIYSPNATSFWQGGLSDKVPSYSGYKCRRFTVKLSHKSFSKNPAGFLARRGLILL